MDIIKISFCSTNQNPVALYHILDGPSVKLTLFQPPTVVTGTWHLPAGRLTSLIEHDGYVIPKRRVSTDTGTCPFKTRSMHAQPNTLTRHQLHKLHHQAA
jgi:hypothetical protein